MKLQVIGIVILAVIVLDNRIAEGHSGSVVTRLEHKLAKNSEPNGFWQKNVSWKSRWVKSWRQKAVYIPLWKRVWGPVVHNEWVPIPKPPPDWQHDIELKKKW